MTKNKFFARLIGLILGASIVSCNHGDGLKAGLQEDASKSNRLLQELDNVPRVFAVDKLEKLKMVPKISEQEGTVVGIVTEDRSIVCVDEAVLNKILCPLIAAHIPKVVRYIPEIPLSREDFSIQSSSFQLSPRGDLLLAVDFVIAGEIRHTGYLPLVLSNSVTDDGKYYVVMPPNHSLGSCISQRCEGEEGTFGICQFNSTTGCLCHRNSFDVGGCLTIW